jgi:hypothetical protein
VPSEPSRFAFVDESYSPKGALTRAYVMSAVIVVGELTRLRKGIRQLIAPRETFHATEHARDGDLAAIHDMLTWISEFESISVIRHSFQSPEEARRECLTKLLIGLNELNVSRVALDSRRRPFGRDPAAADRRDAQVVRSLISRGSLPRHFRSDHYSDRAEPLLWAADALAWVMHRAVATNETAWLDYRACDVRIDLFHPRVDPQERTRPAPRGVHRPPTDSP